MAEVIGQTGILGIPIFVEISNVDTKGGFLKDLLMIAIGAGLTAVVTYGNFFFLRQRNKSDKIRQFSNELNDIYVWSGKAVKAYSRCRSSLSGPPSDVKLGETTERDITYVPSFYWAISSDPASIIESFSDFETRLGVRYFYLWFDNVWRENDKLKDMVHDHEVFIETTRADAENNYGRILFSLVMLMKHISLYKTNGFQGYSSFMNSSKKLDESFMKQLEEELNTKLPRWG